VEGAQLRFANFKKIFSKLGKLAGQGSPWWEPGGPRHPGQVKGSIGESEQVPVKAGITSLE